MAPRATAALTLLRLTLAIGTPPHFQRDFRLFAQSNDGKFPSGPAAVHWMAPLLSGGGYCSEATAFLDGLLALGVRASAEQHGDSFNANYVDGQSPAQSSRLQRLMSTRIARVRGILTRLCHSGTPRPSVPGGALPRRSAVQCLRLTDYPKAGRSG